MRNIEHMPNICLNMIVKNESEIIVEAFDNIRKYIDISLFIICDTGSSDDTISVMKNYFDSNQLKYEIYSDEWIDFEYNRNLALKRCADKSDYILFFDAALLHKHSKAKLLPSYLNLNGNLGVRST